MLNEKALEAAYSCYSEGGCFGLDERERREVVEDIITAYLSAITPDEPRQWQPIETAPKDGELGEVWQRYVDANEARIDAESRLAELEKALEPFAAVAEHDIGDDETDDDIFWPISNARYSMSGRLRVGHLRAARRALKGGENG